MASNRLVMALCCVAVGVQIQASVLPPAAGGVLSARVKPRLVAPHALSLKTRLRGGEQKTSGLPIADSTDDLQDAGGTVTIKLSINYGVDKGSIVAVGPSKCFGSGDIHKAPKLKRKGGSGDVWEGEVTIPRSEGVVKYQYVVLSHVHRYEARIADRAINVLGLPEGSTVDVQDSFRSPKPATLATACFSRAVFGKGKDLDKDLNGDNPGIDHAALTWTPPGTAESELTVRFTLFAPRIDAGHSVWVTGAADSLGNWDGGKRLRMAHIGRGIYVAQASVASGDVPLEYKYEVVDSSGGIVCSEKNKRKLERASAAKSARFLVKDEAFAYPNPVFKGAGVAIPVSGIKTRASMGLGEFLDIKPMADWCVKTGLQLIQILPINDSGEDPSPYSAASSFALHPIYVRPGAVCDYYADKCGTDMTGKRGWCTDLIEKLNGNWKIDYARILQEKSKLMDGIFDKVGIDKIMEDEDMLKWIEANKKWLEPYAGFKVQMMKEREFNNKWWDCTTWSKRASEISSIVNSGSPDFDKIARVYFVQ
jgi:4-alpha-glucanotransferase